MKTNMLMSTLFYLVFGAMIPTSGVGQEKEITFSVTIAESLMKADEKIYIAGNVKQLGNWQADGVPMKKISTSRWELTLTFPPGERLEYKFTRGSWRSEEVMADGLVPGNKYLIVRKNQIVEHTIDNWKDFHFVPIGGITGRVEYHNNFYSDNLKNERTIIVWLPPTYITGNKRYPVLYMHDGQNIIDPKTSYMGIDWQMDETVDSLIQQGRIEEIIIVGIYNTGDRMFEYADTEKGRAYMDFVVHEVKPFIDKNYRTKPDRENTAIMGSSMGGLISFYLVWRFPHIFSKAACLSTTIHWNNGAMFREIENFNGPGKNIKIYFDNGGIGSEGQMTPFYRNMNELLVSKGFEMGKDIDYFYDEKGDHSESSWAKRAWRPLMFLFANE